eukprot:252230-Rhodomonas_salina.2
MSYGQSAVSKRFRVRPLRFAVAPQFFAGGPKTGLLQRLYWASWKPATVQRNVDRYPGTEAVPRTKHPTHAAALDLVGHS